MQGHGQKGGLHFRTDICWGERNPALDLGAQEHSLAKSRPLAVAYRKSVEELSHTPIGSDGGSRRSVIVAAASGQTCNREKRSKLFKPGTEHQTSPLQKKRLVLSMSWGADLFGRRVIHVSSADAR